MRGNIFTPNVPTGQGVSVPGIHANYTAELVVTRDGKPYITMETPLPENFSIALASTFSRPFAQPLSQLATEAAGVGQTAAQYGEQMATVSTGATTQIKYMSAAIWTSGSYISIDIPFVVHAFADPKKEVAEKVMKLLQLAAPSELLGLLVAPGPRVLNASELMGGNPGAALSLGGDVVKLYIGNFLVIEPCVINNVVSTFDTQFDENGTPIAATINVSVEGYFTTTKEDLARFFAPTLGAT